MRARPARATASSRTPSLSRFSGGGVLPPAGATFRDPCPGRLDQLAGGFPPCRGPFLCRNASRECRIGWRLCHPYGSPCRTGSRLCNVGELPCHAGELPCNTGGLPCNAGEFLCNAGSSPCNMGSFSCHKVPVDCHDINPDRSKGRASSSCGLLFCHDRRSRCSNGRGTSRPGLSPCSEATTECRSMARLCAMGSSCCDKLRGVCYEWVFCRDKGGSPVLWREVGCDRLRPERFQGALPLFVGRRGRYKGCTSQAMGGFAAMGEPGDCHDLRSGRDSFCRPRVVGWPAPYKNSSRCDNY
jgi:hypothetical protein